MPTIEGANMHNAVIKVGDKYGRWTVLGIVPGAPRHECLCECGTSRSVVNKSLTRGVSKSCGCARNEATAERNRIHKSSGSKPRNSTYGRCHGSPTWISWQSMLQRCKPDSKDRHRYSERGITICVQWLSFEVFLSDMGERPSVDHSIDRIDNDGNYEPGNCRWATRKEQGRNQRSNRREPVFGLPMTAGEAAEKYGLKYSTLRDCFRQGVSLHEKVLRMLGKQNCTHNAQLNGEYQ